MKNRSLLCAAACCAVVFAMGLLQTTAAEEFEQHPPHEHGKLTLNAALDHNELAIELISPAINVVGFEHEPRSDAERASVDAAAKLLSNGHALFTLPKAARCQFEKAQITAPQWEATDDVPGQPEPPGPHADYEVRFEYQCWSPGDLKWLEPTLLDKLRNVSEARLNITTARGQLSQIATSGSARITFP